MTLVPVLAKREIVLLVLAILIISIGKAWTVASYAPLVLGDNGGFVEGADEVLSGRDWMSDAQLDEHVAPNTLWRPIGYILIVAAVKAVFADHWALAIGTLQAVFSLGVGLLLFRLCAVAKLGFPISIMAIFLHQWSTPISTDPLIMQDSLIGSFGTLACMLILFPIVQGRRPSVLQFFGAGCLVAICFLIREVFHYVVPILAVVTCLFIGKSAGWRRGLLSAGALSLPLFCAVVTIQAWNYERTGHAVITTAGQTVYAYALLRAARYDPSLLAGNSDFHAVMRESNKAFDYLDARRTNSRLFEEYGLNSLEQSRIARETYWQSLFANPIPFIQASLERVRIVQQATLFSGPIARIDDLEWWAGLTPERGKFIAGIEPDNFGFRRGWRVAAAQFLKTWNISDLTFEAAMQGGARLLVRCIGLLLLLLFLIGTPLLWLCLRDTAKGVVHAAFVGWVLYCLWVCLYVPVSFEVRYLSPIIAGAIFALAVVLAHSGQLFSVIRRRTIEVVEAK